MRTPRSKEFLAAVSIERQAIALRRLQHAVNDDLFGLWLGFPRDLVLVADGIAGFAPDMAWQTARTWDLSAIRVIAAETTCLRSIRCWCRPRIRADR